MEKFCKEDKSKDEKEKDEAVPRKKEKMETNWTKRQAGVGGVGCRASRRSAPVAVRDKKRPQSEVFGKFHKYIGGVA